MSGFRVVIPARYGSTRLPGKPLADIAGKPMVVRVAESARRAEPDGIWIATDDARVVEAAAAHGCQALMTRPDHASGTDRIGEVARQLGWHDDEIVVNVQGDEPLIDPELIKGVAAALAAQPQAALATAAHTFDDAAAFFNPNVVKVVTDAAGRALYFSRAPLPWHRDGFAAGRDGFAAGRDDKKLAGPPQEFPGPLGGERHWGRFAETSQMTFSGGGRLPPGFAPRRHIGIYAYRVAFLKRFAQLAPAPIEQWEALEQLRALWHGFHIAVIESAQLPAPGVDTTEDLEFMRKTFAALH